MSPEIAVPLSRDGGRVAVDERSDVFSLGASIYEIVTGRLPYLPPCGDHRSRTASKIAIIDFRASPDFSLDQTNIDPSLNNFILVSQLALQRDCDYRLWTQ